MSRYLDLILTAAITVLTGALVIAFPGWSSPVRIALGLIVVLVAPGYVITNLLFPTKDDVDGVERLALTLGLSIVAIPLLGLILNYTPWGIRLGPIAIGVSILVSLFALLGAWRRASLEPGEAFVIPWGTRGFYQGSLLLAIVMAVLLGVPALAVALRPAEEFTEFYVLGSEGKLESYPTELAPGETFMLTFGVANHEGKPMTYQLHFPFDQANETVLTPEIATGESWEADLELVAPEGDAGAARTRLPFELRRPGDNEPYRLLHLFVRIEGEAASEAWPSGTPAVTLDPATAPAPQPAQTYRTHRVQPSETLYGLARQYLGDGSRYLEFFELNRDVLTDPLRIPTGVELRIPNGAP